MGKIRTKLIGLEEVEKKQKNEAKTRREQKKKKEEKIRPVGGKGGERMMQVAVSDEALAKMEKAKKILEEKKPEKAEKKETKKKVSKRTRGKNYQKAKERIDKNKKYSLEEAVSLLKKIKYAQFDESVEVHINISEKGLKGEVVFPHGIGKQTRVAIVNDEILKEIEKGKINFDVLITHPQYMPKLAKLAKILGPKGLMPNPKAGTISENPEMVAKKYQQGSIRFKTEPKFPIIHQVVGKLSFEEKKLIENIQALISAIGRSKILSLYLKSTMSPSIKIET